MPFISEPQGFRATLGVMENPRTACYHIYKKGFCRHGSACRKEHPAIQVPIHVIIETAQLDSCKGSTGVFEQEVADLAMAVTVALSGSMCCGKVEAIKDNCCQGWTIEVTPTEELKPHKDMLLQLAKDTLFNATCTSDTLYIMGYGSKPFIAKSQGFITILGNMADESGSCWDFYNKGFCTRGCECKWAHPKFMMPINLVMKEKSSLQRPPAVLE